MLAESFKRTHLSQCSYNALLPSEIDFISAISAHLCAFRLRGVGSLAYMPTILAHGRASLLEAATSACLLVPYLWLSCFRSLHFFLRLLGFDSIAEHS